jgi:hypothetical protein
VYDKRLLVQAQDMNKRYRVVTESVSNHCCFEATVIDTENLNQSDRSSYHADTYGIHFKTVCETFTLEEARMVCNALNYADGLQRGIE